MTRYKRESSLIMKRIIIALVMCVSFIQPVHTAVDFIILSKDRPMQLYLLLESMHKYLKGVGTVSVLYLATEADFELGYTQVQKDFPAVLFVQQPTDRARETFKPLLCKLVEQVQTRYMALAVDDDVVIDYVDLNDCVGVLERTRAYAFYLRLGKDITECYSANKVSGLPAVLQEVEPGVYTWKFKSGSWEWFYPHSVDMTIFKKSSVLKAAKKLIYTTPNTFEGCWAGTDPRYAKRYGACYALSKTINIPMNLVQIDWKNRHGNLGEVKELLHLFLNEHKKIDVQLLEQLPHNAPHVECMPQFITR